MTNYYYIASDQKLLDWHASLELMETEEWLMPGFTYPVQREIFNGVEKPWELRELYQYVQHHLADYEECTVQIAHLINPAALKIQNKSTVAFHELSTSKQLLLAEGELLTIQKVPC